MEKPKTNFLSMIKTPSDLKVLSASQRKMLAREVRYTILSTVAKTGGHLASPLGVVELTIALHTAFDAPSDKIIFDVGNQGYAHKLLTGRSKQFSTLRQFGGLSGFLKRSESEYDVFDAGHSSTSISAGIGIAKARDLLGESYHVIPIIGDGAMTAGLAFEGLNHAGYLKSNMIVILNDNNMSISPNVGALKQYLNKMVMHPSYTKTRGKILRFLSGFSEGAASGAAELEKSLQAVTGPGMLFKELGYRYFGPIDGHDMEAMIKLFRNIKQLRGPILIHVRTKKGLGYKPAYSDAEKFHGAAPFDLETGEAFTPAGKPSHMTYTQAMVGTLISLAKEDERICAITAAMGPGTGLNGFAKEFPDRFFDVGIAEQHAATFAAGLASAGMKPLVGLYSTFLQRAYDSVIHDCCLMNLPVVFAIDRAGLTGEDGATHHGAYDVSFLRTIPNLTIMSPKDENETARMVKTAFDLNSPCVIRYPKGAGTGVGISSPLKPLDVGKAEVVREGTDVLVIAFGPIVHAALEAADALSKKKISCCVVNARFAKPLDASLIVKLARKIRKVVTVEENALLGGFGSAVGELLQAHDVVVPIKSIGIGDEFVDHGTKKQLNAIHGIDVNGIMKVALGFK
ncbi:MAG: 1-deoxy-D-xylulose-5-phosphate synthase [Nanoarchaeota archaeon]|nr:1-deoxy-D-xylulose-5-phosphate synthase [Nanoarchaeota archaeon]